MIKLELVQVDYGVVPLPDGSKVLGLVDPKSGIQVLIPLDEPSAKNMAALLSSSGIVAADASDVEALRRAAEQNGQ